MFKILINKSPICSAGGVHFQLNEHKDFRVAVKMLTVSMLTYMAVWVVLLWVFVKIFFWLRSSLDVHFGWGSTCWYQGGKSDSVYVTLQFISLWCGLCVYSVLSDLPMVCWFGESKMSFSIQRAGRGNTVNGLQKGNWLASQGMHSFTPSSSWECVLHFGLNFLLTDWHTLQFIFPCNLLYHVPTRVKSLHQSKELLLVTGLDFTQENVFLYLPTSNKYIPYFLVAYYVWSNRFHFKILTCAISETYVLQSFFLEFWVAFMYVCVTS